MEQLLDSKSAAARLGTEERVLVELTNRGALPAIRLSCGWRFRAEELDNFVVASGLYRDPSIADRTMRGRLARWNSEQNLLSWRVPPDLVSDSATLPEWARQGHLHFARFDGGVRHHEKAVLSAWQSSGFSKDVAELARDAYAPETLAKIASTLRNAGITAAWVSWSLGFSLEHESEQFEQCRRAIDALHEHGIKAFAYLSCNNFFWEQPAARDPSVVGMTLCEGGVHLTYEHSPHRRLADLRHPAWLKLSKQRLRAAIEAGVDGLFYDNCEAPTEDLAYFLPRLRHFLRHELDSSVPLMLNLHLYHRPQNFILADLVDIIYNEWGFKHSGVDDDGCWNVVSIRNPIRYIAGTWPGRPMIYEMPRSMTNVIRPRAEKLHTFEAAAFGGEASRYIEGYMSVGQIRGIPEVRDVWKAIGEAHEFLDAHRDLYSNTESVARIAVGVFGPNWCAELLDELTRMSLAYDIVEMRTIDRIPLDRYRLLLIPGGLEAPDSRSLPTLSKFRSGGGKVVVVSDHAEAFGGVADEVWPGAVAHLWRMLSPGGPRQLDLQAAGRLRDTLLQIAGPPIISVEGEYVLASLRISRDNNLWVLHLLNYYNLPASNVHVRLQLPKGSSDLRVTRILSPDRKPPEMHELQVVDKQTLHIRLPALDQYAVIPIALRPMEDPVHIR